MRANASKSEPQNSGGTLEQTSEAQLMIIYRVEIELMSHPAVNFGRAITDALQELNGKLISVARRTSESASYVMCFYIPRALTSEGNLRRFIACAVKANFGGAFRLQTSELSIQQAA